MFIPTRGNLLTSWVSESQTPALWFTSVWFSFCEEMKKILWSLWYPESHPECWLGEAEESEPWALPRGWCFRLLLCAAGSEHLWASVTPSFFPRWADPDGWGQGGVGTGCYFPSRFHGLSFAHKPGWVWEEKKEGTKEGGTRQRFIKGAALES